MVEDVYCKFCGSSLYEGSLKSVKGYCSKECLRTHRLEEAIYTIGENIEKIYNDGINVIK